MAEAAERFRTLHNPGGGYSGPWRNAMVPYLVQVMQALTDPRWEKVAFCAPAQAAKTEIGLNWVNHSVLVDPANIQVVLPEKQAAEDFSTRRIGLMIEKNEHMLALDHSRTKYLVDFTGRCLVNLSWPSSSNASSKPIPRQWLDEVDSMPEDVDGEGDPVDLYHKRSQTFGARRKTLITSSPKRPPAKGAGKPRGAHEAPATTGILSLYNQGTRRQFYWPCRACGEFFVTRVKDLHWADGAKSDDQQISTWFACPHCGAVHEDDDRRRLWLAGQWVGEGETIRRDGIVEGALRNVSIDSYWLFGPQARFITLEELARKRLLADEELQKTGSDTKLRVWWNTDAGEIYFPPSDAELSIAADELQEAAKDTPIGIVPEGGEVLVASIDNGVDRFEIAWTAHGRNGESWLVDYQRIVAIAADGTPITTGGGAGGAVALQGAEACDPAHRLDHWLALMPTVFDRVLPLAADPSKGLRPLVVAMDTHGPSGATDKAYRFARWLRRERPDVSNRAMFLRGRGELNPIRVARAQWDPRVTAGRATSRKGVDLWNVYVNLLKDTVVSRLRQFVKAKGERGPDRLHLSAHLPEAIFQQLCAETRDGEVWVNERRVRNEGLDLAVYGLAAWLRLGGDKIDWSDPPGWAIAKEQALPIGPQPAKAAPPPKPPAPVAPANPIRLPRRGGWVNSWRS